MRSVRHFPILLPCVALSFIGCVPSGKFHDMEKQAHLSDSLYTQSMRTLKGCQDDNIRLGKEKSTLQEHNKEMSQQVTAANEVNGQLRKQMEQLSAVSSAQAESIKRSLDNMGANDSYMIALHSAITYRDSVNLALLFILKQTIGGYGEQNVSIKLEKGAVHVDLSDSLLFGSDSAGYTVSEKATQVLGHLARALTNAPDVEFTVEGQVDSLNAPADSVHDNWDLALRRASAVVRILQNDQVSPTRMTAAGTTSLPVEHRTRILFTPKTELLSQLLEHGPGGQSAAPPPPAPAGQSAAPPAAPAANSY
ncbi:MAG TPA: OmpA family protein [Puia sp.]|jgi:chemotaxis protein MotB|nr:OmpA family protein [Puia sp.]